MCYSYNPTQVYYSKCTHRVLIPEDGQARKVQCPPYQGTTQWHDSLESLHAASSTNRRDKCPPCVRSELEKSNGKDKGEDGDKDGGGQQVIARPTTKVH